MALERRPLTASHYRAVWSSISASYAKGRYAENATEERFRACFEVAGRDPALGQDSFSLPRRGLSP